MDYLVEFLESGARIIKDPLLIEKKKDLPNVMLNPDVSHLKGVSPSFWVKEGDTIGTLHPQESLKMVMDSLEEKHSFDGPSDAPLSSTSKFVTKLEEIDAKREQDMHNLLKALKHSEKDMLRNVGEIDDKYAMIIQDLEYQVQKNHRQLRQLSFLYILVMILLKFL